MKRPKKRYLVFRVYQRDEDHEDWLYGWTFDRNVVKVFLEQRDTRKYSVRKISEEELADLLSDVPWDSSNMIDYVELPVSATGKSVTLFMTKNELCEVEKRIQRYFRKLSTIIDNEHGSFVVLNLFQNLIPRYLDALDFLGFRPPELENMDESVPYHGCPEDEDDVSDRTTSWEIDQAYQLTPMIDHQSVPGMSMLTKVSTQIIYSLESFIIAMREDL